MIKFFLACSVVFFVQAFFAQDTIIETTYFDFGNWDKNYYAQFSDTAYVFADQTNVRKDPAIKSEIVSTLPIGTAITILERSTSYITINGVRSSWIKVKRDTLEGFVWGGLLCQNYLPMPQNQRLFWGVTNYRLTDTSMSCKITLRLVGEDAQYTEVSFNPKYASQPNIGRLVRLDNPKLEGVESIVVFETMAEACGVYASETNFLFTGNALKYVGGGFSMGDGGVLFESTSYRFPFANMDTNMDYHYLPEENRVLKIVSEGSYDEACVWVETNKVVQYEWKDGEFILYCDN